MLESVLLATEIAVLIRFFLQLHLPEVALAAETLMQVCLADRVVVDQEAPVAVVVIHPHKLHLKAAMVVQQLQMQVVVVGVLPGQVQMEEAPEMEVVAQVRLQQFLVPL